MPKPAEGNEILEDTAKYVRMKHTNVISDLEHLESFSEFGIHESELVWSSPARLKPSIPGSRITLSLPYIHAGR
jgi:hypothetical protein